MARTHPKPRWWDWITVSELRSDDHGKPYIVVRVRTWHPGFWVAWCGLWLRVLLRRLTGH